MKFKIIWVPIVLMLVGGAVMIGLTDYITAGFSLSVFSKPEFWSNLLCTNGGTLCMILAILLMRIDKFKEANKEFLDTQEFIQNYYRDSSYRSVIFNKYCAEINRKEKIEVFIESIKKKFTKYTNKKSNPENIEVYTKGTEEEKKNNEYCKKLKYYETLMSDEYINESIDNLRIKHNTISESLVFMGISTHSYKRDYITKHKFLKVFKDLLPKYLLTFAVTFLVSTITPDFKEGITIVALIKTATKLFTVCSQIYFAYNYSNKYCNEVIMHDICFRKNIINNYTLWLTRKAKEKEV